MKNGRICVLLLTGLSIFAATAPIPQIVNKDGRWALMVDGEPYLALGAQVNNSSAWPAMLPRVWPAIQAIGANTVEMPVYWEQFEPESGRFDYSVLDTLISQAREHHVRLVLLWFGTWKNSSSQYQPAWMKQDRKKYFLLRTADGKVLNSPSPFATATLEADKKAFSALMRHVRDVDPQRTVILVQVENEAGTYGALRDYGEAANAQFAKPVPPQLLGALHTNKSGDWRSVFGDDADEFFHAWAIARYVNEVVAAGKAEYPLPMYINVALRDPFHATRGSYEQGGATDNVIDIWKATAPALDLIAPDMYMPDSDRYLKELDLYSRPDNALYVPENGDTAGYARYLFAALGHGAFGWAPFGIDFTDYSNAPLGAAKLDDDALKPFAINYQLLRPIDRLVAKLQFEGKLQAVAEQKGKPQETLRFGDWQAAISYGLGELGPTTNVPGNPEAIGRVLIAQLGPNEFLVGGFFCRVEFSALSNSRHAQYVAVQEGQYEGDTFVPIRNWNGDQIDWGMNFRGAPRLLHVTLTSYW